MLNMLARNREYKFLSMTVLEYIHIRERRTGIIISLWTLSQLLQYLLKVTFRDVNDDVLQDKTVSGGYAARWICSNGGYAAN